MTVDTSRWRGRWIALGSTILGYVGLNLVLINVPTCIHRVELEVEIVRETDHEAIPTAIIAWPARKHSAREELGKTGPDGKLKFTTTIQQQPMWAFPVVGTINFRSLVLDVKAAGYRTQLVRLADELPNVSLRNPTARLRVKPFTA